MGTNKPNNDANFIEGGEHEEQIIRVKTPPTGLQRYFREEPWLAETQYDWQRHWKIQDLQEKGPDRTLEETAELNGLMQFPNNPRGVELVMKSTLQTISQEERTELNWLILFPNNPRGAELFIKNVLQTISSEETAELNGLLQEQLQRETRLKFGRGGGMREY